MEAWEQGLRLQKLPLRGVSGAISGETKHTTNIVQAATATTSLPAGSEKAASPPRTARTTFHILMDHPKKGGPECGRYPSLDALPKSRVDGCVEVPPTFDGLDQTHGKLVHAAGETSARVNSKAVT